MTDHDVMTRVASLFERALISLPRRKPQYRVPFASNIKGSAAIDLMLHVLPFVGPTRQAQIERAVASYAAPRARRAGARNDPLPTVDARRCGADCEEAWLAGLLEGEGTFTLTRSGGLAYPVASVHMTDRAVILRAARILGVRDKVWVEVPRHDGWKTTYATAVSGAAGAQWMRHLYPLMGERRRAAIDKALAAYAPIRLIDPPETCVVPGCDDPHRSRGLCHKHYMSWLRDVEKGRTPRVTPLR